MKPTEIIERIKKENPKLLGNLADQKAARIVLAALAQLGSEIDAMDEGVVKVAGFGNFRVRQVEREKDGKKVTLKRTFFVAAKRKSVADKGKGRTE